MGTDGSSDHHAQAAQEDHHQTPFRNGIVGKQDAAARDAAMRLATMMAVPAALNAAIELGVFEILAKVRGAGKSLTAKEIASQVLRLDSGGLSVINDRYLERILRLLASENVVRESAVTVASANSRSSTERCYALQPVGTYFVTNDEDAASLAPLIIASQDRDFIKPWHHLSATVLDDSTDPFRKAHGESLFQLPATIHGSTKSSTRGWLSNRGSTCKLCWELTMASRTPNAWWMLEVVQGPRLPSSLPSTRTFEESIMIYPMSSQPRLPIQCVLHDWDDSECVTILRNCFNALPTSGGKVIVVESVLPDLLLQSELGAGPTVAFRMDLIMLAVASVGARERTLQEFQELAKTAGFASISVVVSIDYLSVLEFNKA